MQPKKLKFKCPACTTRVVLVHNTPCPHCGEQLEPGQLLAGYRKLAKKIASVWLLMLCLGSITGLVVWMFTPTVSAKYTCEGMGEGISENVQF